MKERVVEYSQFNVNFASTVLPLDSILAISKVLAYESDSTYGYQRSISESRSISIKNAILRGELVSPTSIVLGINESDWRKIKNDSFNLKYHGQEKVFRIIDGQHRIEGFRKAVSVKPELSDFEFSVIIMILEDSKRYPEVEVFNNINSKSIRVKTDLALLAKYKYNVIESIDYDIAELITVQSIFDLVSSESVWKNGIKLEVNDKYAPGIVSFKSFFDSLIPIVKRYLELKEFKKTDKETDIPLSYRVGREFNEHILLKIWGVVQSKWPECFQLDSIEYNQEFLTKYYSSKYHIQKVMGVKAILKIVKECVDSGINFDDSLREFSLIINNSKMRSSDWLQGDRLDGLNSLAGIEKIIQVIKGEN
jgi:DGQHR domain-containing protein